MEKADIVVREHSKSRKVIAKWWWFYIVLSSQIQRFFLQKLESFTNEEIARILRKGLFLLYFGSFVGILIW